MWVRHLINSMIYLLTTAQVYPELCLELTFYVRHGFLLSVNTCILCPLLPRGVNFRCVKSTSVVRHALVTVLEGTRIVDRPLTVFST